MVEHAKIGILYRDRPPQFFLDATPERMPWTFESFQESTILDGPLVPAKDYLAIFYSMDSDDPEIQRHISNMFPGASLVGYRDSGQISGRDPFQE